MSGTHETRVLIIGAGFAGIGMAAALRRRGIEDFVIVERGADVGGTWRDNTYPGATCDVPSHLYSFSWALNPNWSRSFSPQPEIWDYLRRVARQQDVYRHCLFGAELLDARWDPAALRWTVHTSRGAYSARFLVSGAGALCEPADPDLSGLSTFAGPTFHSARWRHDLDLTGQRVAVIGTGASAVQFVPEIADRVGRLDVYQRTAPWVVPRGDRALSRPERWIYRHVPGAQRLARTAIYWGRESYVLGFAKNRRFTAPAARLGTMQLHRQVADLELRARLRPHFTIGCKRILLSNDWYPTLQRPNVELVTDKIVEVRPNGIVAADGQMREADVIIFGTGFHVTDMPIAAHIYDGTGQSLAEHWRDGATAHRGTTVAGYPNLFFIVGPNTGLGHTSMVFMIESQVRYICAAMTQMQQTDVAAVQPKRSAQRAFNVALQRQLAGTVWNAGGCASWYLDAHGRNTTLWPDFTFRFRRATSRFDLREYETI